MPRAKPTTTRHSRSKGKGQGRRPRVVPARVTAADARRLVEELDAQKEQLQAQNEQLRAAQHELEVSRNRYAELYDFAPVGYVCLDHQGLILELNLTTASLLGVERFRVVGDPFQLYVAKPDAKKFLTHLSQCKRSRKTVRTELMLAARCGPPRWVQAVTVAVVEPEHLKNVFHTSLTDITERKRAEHALLASEEQYRLLFERNPHPMWISNRATLGFMAVNDAAIENYGYTREEFLAMSLKDLRAPRTAADPFPTRAARQAAEGASLTGFAGSWRHRRKDGTLIEVEITRRPVVFEGTSAWLVLAHDITDRRRADEKLKQYAEQQTNLSRQLLEVQETERGNIARELHDQLGQLLTGLKLSLRTSADHPTENIKADLERAEGLVSDLTTRVRDLALDLRPSLLDDLGLLPALMWHFDRYTEQTRVRVAFHHAGIETKRFEPQVETAAYRIVQEALNNVARHAAVSDAIVRVWSGGGRLHIQVEDSGNGFDPATVMGGTRSRGLTGMRERANLLGGDLTVESAVGGGTRLTAELVFGKADAEEVYEGNHCPGG